MKLLDQWKFGMYCLLVIMKRRYGYNCFIKYLVEHFAALQSKNHKLKTGFLLECKLMSEFFHEIVFLALKPGRFWSNGKLIESEQP